MTLRLAVLLQLALLATATLRSSTAHNILPQTDTPCSINQRYRVSFDFKIQAGVGNFTDGLAVAPTTLAAHSDHYTMWTRYGYASPGVALVAETGDPMLLREELDVLRAANLVKTYKGTDMPGPGNGTVELRIGLSQHHPYMSSAAMMAPSGDWFFGLSRMRMCSEATGMWYAAARIELKLYDAGVDGLEQFAFDPETPTEPVENIQLVEGFPVPNGETVCVVTIHAIQK